VVESGRSPISPPGSCGPAAGPGGRRRLPDGPLRVALPLGALTVRRSGVTGSPPPPRRVVRPRGVPSSGLPRTGVRGGSRRLGPLSGLRATVPGPGIAAEPFPSWGSSPLRRRRRAGPLLPGLPPRHVPSSRFPTSSTVCSPHALRPLGPLPSMGFLSRSEAASAAEPLRVRVAAHPSLRGPLPRGFRSPRSEEWEVGDTETPDRSRLVRPRPDVGRRPRGGPGAVPFGALHPAPAAATGVAAIPPARLRSPFP
jgi:hypothetical protein